MDTIFAVVLRLSLSGGFVILLLLVCGRLLKGKLGWGWMYYLWLTAIFRLLLPFSLKLPVLPNLTLVYSHQEQRTEQSQSLTMAEPSSPNPAEAPLCQENKRASVLQYLWGLWAAGTAAAFGKRCWDYRRFLHSLRQGWKPVLDSHLLERFQRLKLRAGVRMKVSLYVHPELSTPMLIGLLRPCVVLPSLDLPESELDLTVLHELVHCRRRDALYKCLIQICLCLHWFNPLVYRMERELSRLCELSCDETILKDLAPQERAAYGDTLVNSLLYSGRMNVPQPSPALKRENSLLLLKERLGEIMKTKRKSKTVLLLSAVLTCVAVCAAAVTGVQAKEMLVDSIDRSLAESEIAKSLFALLNPASVTAEGISSSMVQPEYICPVEDDKNIYISAEYVPGFHNGIDFAAEKGTPILAVADGTVEAAGKDTKNGRYIVILHSDGTESRYYHCNTVFVTVGQKVQQGEKIAEIGQTGFATGPHLHIEFRKDEKTQDPTGYIKVHKDSGHTL